MKALEVENLSYKMKSDWLIGGKTILEDLSFSVETGQVFGLLGTNGAGKTTTIKCILNLLKIKSGQIKIFGNEHFLTYSRKDLAYLPEHTYFYDNIKVKESLKLAANLSSVKNVKTELERVVDLLKIKSLLDKKLKNMSKGQKQRVSLAQTLISNPKIIILDEPYSGLDPVGRQKFTEIFLSLKEAGVSMLVSSHILSDIERIADKVIILNAGKTVGEYSINKLEEHVKRSFELLVKSSKDEKLEVEEVGYSRTNEVASYIFNSKNEADKALNLAINKNLEVVSFGQRHGGLEELFVNMVKGN